MTPLPDPVRQEILLDARTIVVKVGTNVLADAVGRLDQARVQALSDQLVRILHTGRHIVLVSSGAIGAGIGKLALLHRPTDLPHLQACAAIGQNVLMQLYQDCLHTHGVQTGQILLTAGDFDHRVRYLNARNTIHTLLEWGCLPIINENDTISVAEIRFGDNDSLAAMVTNLLQASLLILLTNVDGLFTSDPEQDPTARIVSTVPHIDRSITEMAGTSRSHLGTGGMRSKLRAARLATAAGESVIMANGTRPGILDAILAGEPVGTLFLPHGSTVPARKRWFGYTAQPRGQLHVDAGAVAAICRRGRSLLPIGVIQVVGRFGKGDVVAVCGPEGQEVARGLCNYTAEEAIQIKGLRTEQVTAVLGQVPYIEMIHRDNLAILD